MGGLDRSQFHVSAVCLGACDPLSEPIKQAVDAVVQLPRAVGALQGLALLKPHVLVYADQHSEPLAPFLAQHRLAPVQAVFWGNPVTSGHRHSIDYFISGEKLEHTPVHHGHYVEQVVLLGGQGVYLPRPPRTTQATECPLSTKEHLRTLEPSVTFSCLQSAHKFHPLFVHALAEILLQVPGAVLLLLKSRRPEWEALLKEQMDSHLHGEVRERVLWLPRARNKHTFLQLMACSDVVLQPWPFDGAGTAADALSLHLPLVTMPTEHLRGRMACALLQTVGAHNLVARNTSDFVRIAVELGRSPSLRYQAQATILQGHERLWEQQAYVLDWQLWLQRVTRRSRGSIGSTLDSLRRNQPHAIWNEALQEALDSTSHTQRRQGAKWALGTCPAFMFGELKMAPERMR